MGQTNRHASAWPSLAVLLAVSLSALQPAIADDTPEREQLAALARQLDLIHRLAEHAATTAPQATSPPCCCCGACGPCAPPTVGWAEHRITERQFLTVVVRFVAMYLVLTFFLLS